jgi:integrase/recombinase XerD
MKKLVLNNPSFEYLLKGFSEWLDVLGYCKESVYTLPNYLREFLYHLEKQGVVSITQLTQAHIKKHHDYLSSRPHQRQGGGLSDKYILMHMQAIEKLLEYLHHRGKENLPTLGIRLAKPERKQITVLSTQEIKLLFDTTDKESGHPLQEAFNARSKVLLVVYYSCGLRKNEGAHLEIDDINFDTRVLHVRKGKNYKERFVPLGKASAACLQQYIYDYRPQLVKSKKENRLFISRVGGAMTGGSLYTCFKKLQLQTEDIQLQQKAIGLHTLRHSIATHLLQNGMSLEKIARFLGHASLDSTQIYTHLVEPQTTPT